MPVSAALAAFRPTQRASGASSACRTSQPIVKPLVRRIAVVRDRWQEVAGFVGRPHPDPGQGRGHDPGGLHRPGQRAVVDRAERDAGQPGAERRRLGPAEVAEFAVALGFGVPGEVQIASGHAVMIPGMGRPGGPGYPVERWRPGGRCGIILAGRPAPRGADRFGPAEIRYADRCRTDEGRR
jgi:hypothetical protein